ncbi:MAG: diaminopimelate epimerase [Spirochaetales bacterium]|nr:diaminopimelate epimerase [Spirochaetales bacterium]
MDIEFIKLQNTGNDYIVIDASKNNALKEQHFPELAKKMCSRRFGIGGSGMLMVMPQPDDTAVIRLFLPNGEEEIKCGNALLCAAQYVFDMGITSKKTFYIITGETRLSCEIIDSNTIRAEIGFPLFPNGETVILEKSDKNYTESIIIDEREYSYTPLVVDTPHAVLFVGEHSFPPLQFAKKFEQKSGVSKGLSLDFVKVISREEIQVKTWIQKENEAYGCASGACAAVVAATINGFSDREVVVRLRGGELFIEWEEASGKLFFTGFAEYVFSGNYYFDESNSEKK